MFKPSIKTDKRSSGVKCAACTNNRRNFSGRFFRFPKEKLLFYIWISNCKLSKSDVQGRYNMLCENHFEKKYIGKRKLKKNSIPTLLLPEYEKESKLSSKDYIIYGFSEESMSTENVVSNGVKEVLNLNDTEKEESNHNKIPSSDIHDTTIFDIHSQPITSSSHNEPSTSDSHNLPSLSGVQKIPSKVDAQNLASTVKTPVQTKKYKIKVKEKEEDLFLRACTEIIRENRTENDQYHALGQYVEHKLRNLPNEEQQIFAEGLIMQIIQKATLNKLTESTTI